MTTKTSTLALVLIAGCLKANPNYVAGDGGAPGSDAGSGSDVAPQCTSNAMCSGDAPICELGAGSAHDTCRACSGDSDCTGTATTCLPTGACAGDDLVAYVSPAGSDTNACSAAAPCATLGYALTATALPYIALTGSAGDANGVAIGRAVTVLGRGSASITRAGSIGPAVTVTADGVTLATLAILQAAGAASGDGIQTSTGTLTLEQVQITQNARYGVYATGGKVVAQRSMISHNAAGGLDLSAASFDLENCFIFGNGTTNVSTFGGVYIAGSPSNTDTIQFTTVADNHSAGGTTGGIQCTAQTNALTFEDVVVANNDSTINTQVLGAGCTYVYSDTYPGTIASGTTNVGVAPAFVNEASEDFHLGSNSPLIDQADPAATLKIDIDDQSRPQGLARDMGADEYMP